ncbi:MAG TPA: phosphate ABC transporter permease subunit PstC [bacterium]|nr:phosphate ABC transporter permease subunit PstC [bacterium]
MTKLKENFIKYILFFLSFLSLFFLLGIVVVLFKEGLPLFKYVSLKDFLFGKEWYPTYEPPSFGALPLILGSLWVTLGALILAIPLGIGASIYLSEIAGRTTKEIIKPIIELLAGIPSVVYGFFGVVILAPFIQKIFDLPVGLCALTASIILGIMAIPTITSIADDAISSVPNNYKEASLALGATKLETIFKVVLPASSGGIITAIILGISRAIGETMTVLMVAGGAAIIPHSFLEPVRPLTATIAAEMGEAVLGGIHYNALFSLGIVLFVITLFFNILSDFLYERFKKRVR